jgi:hypothetical protein
MNSKFKGQWVKITLLSRGSLWYSLLVQPVVFVCVLALVAVFGVAAVEAQAPPPTPTLAPVVSDTTSATQTLQLQEFARSEAYMIANTTTYTTTIGGSTWAIERKFSYGEIGVTMVAMALVLVHIFGTIYQIINGRRW